MITAARKIDIKKILSDRGLDGRGRDIWTERLGEITSAEVEWALTRRPGYYVLDRLLILVSQAAENYLERMAQLAHQLTLQRFGRTIRLYAPLYLSNFCVNDCVYCGFNKNHPFPRIRLTIDEALAEAEVIAKEGFKDLLLVSSEDRHFINVDYLCELATKLRVKFSSISAEIYQMSTEEYAKLFAAGIEGVTLYQETYDRDTYRKYHKEGPKADYGYRLSAPDNIAAAGMREIGIGSLLGLSDWRLETLALGEHAHYLMKHYWKSRVSFSFPRLRPAKSVDRKQFSLLSDKNLVQMIIALRLCFADAGVVLSTRESAELRDHLIGVGVTKISAGSKTSPGGYSQPRNAVEQFEIDDTRSPAQIAEMIRAHGLEPVWKDWDIAFVKD
ncbi:MAG: 2-iminoacetate synthase ThiH [Sedimentisphaerales bacterium]